MIPIFLSRPNPFTYEQDLFLSEVISFLKENNMNNITLAAKDYNPYESLSCLNEMIKRCYGMIIIAFGQSYIKNGVLKKGAVKHSKFYDSFEDDLDDLWITTPYCHIEGAIAFSNGLPILILSQKGLKKDDIIISGPEFVLNDCQLSKQFFQTNEFLESFQVWKDKVETLFNSINGKISR